MKHCSRCQRDLPNSSFHRVSEAKLHSYCRTCFAAYRRNRYSRIRNHAAEYTERTKYESGYFLDPAPLLKLIFTTAVTRYVREGVSGYQHAEPMDQPVTYGDVPRAMMADYAERFGVQPISVRNQLYHWKCGKRVDPIIADQWASFCGVHMDSIYGANGWLVSA